MPRMLAIAVLCVACGSNTFGLQIATTPSAILSLVAGDNKIYAYSSGIYEIEPSGGSKPLVSVQTVSMAFAVANNVIFFPLSGTTSGGIGEYDILSGVQRTVVPATQIVRELLADSDRIFWVDSTWLGETTVNAINADGTGAVLLGSGFGIFQDDQALYWNSGGNIVRAPKVDLSSRTSLTTGGAGFFSAAAYGGNVYWGSFGILEIKLLSMPADGSAIAPTVVAVLPIPSAGSQLTAIQFLAGIMYVELMEHEPGDCPGTCFFTARVVKIDSGTKVEVATAEHVSVTPPIVAGAGGLFWALSTSVYRIR